MFFKKKKPKVDPKVRFQNRQFNQKLYQARTFKRTAKPIPEGSVAKLLNQIGLGSPWRKALAILIIGGAVYLIYIPNFLTWQTLVVEGMSESNREATESKIIESISSAQFYNPQKNLLFVSKNRIEEAALSVGAVDRVERIERNFKNKTITVFVGSKYERYLVRSTDNVFDVYNDGTGKSIAGVSRDQWESLINPSMVKVDVNAKIINLDNREFLNQRTSQYISQLEGELKAVTGSTLHSMKIVLPEFKQPLPPVEPAENEEPEIDDTPEEIIEEKPESPTQAPAEQIIETSLPLNADELELVFVKGNNPHRTFRVIIDTNEPTRDIVHRLNLLLSQTESDRYDKLSYIDLRIPTRAFVCLVNSPCTR